ncbi:DUF4157 domain-containing protein [Streptomyces sp. NPDC127098]|uniref:eCIS core domain-containing protein n=1 Tax=Streptomyces sp. NPDC127098 TaxID=3347137 RepID=UPI0036687034
MTLRQQHQGEQKAGRSGRPPQRQPAAAPAAKGATGATDLMALQGAAGNAAVAAMIQRSRSAQGGDDREEHHHGPGGGQEGTAARPVQRLTVHDVLRRPGRSIEPGLRQEMEQRFGGESFSPVQLHTGAEADRSAAELGAVAYTSGPHIVLSRKAVGDKQVLAHELEHYRQQRRGPVTGTDHGDGVSVSEVDDSFERSADAVADRVMRAPLPPTDQGLSAPVGIPGVQRDVQRTADHQAVTSHGHHVHHVQRYDDTDPTPARTRFDRRSGDQLPAFAENSMEVSVWLDQDGQFQADLERTAAVRGPVTLSWSDDETIAMNAAGMAKEFYAVPNVVTAANQSLAKAGSYIRLGQGGHSLTNSHGERLTVVRPRIATDLDDVVLQRFMHLAQHECVEVAQRLVGGTLGHAVFRGEGGSSVTAEIGPRGATGLPRLAAALASDRPPATPREAAWEVQGPDPATAPGEQYGTLQGQRRLRQYERGIGINENAIARVGEALTTHTIAAEPRPGVPANFDFARDREPTGRIWVYHYATVVAESSDRRDQITLENYNRNSLMEEVLRAAAQETGRAYAEAYPGRRMPRAHADRVARELLERETRSALGGMWYFSMYAQQGRRGFHNKNRGTALNAMTVVTTSVPRLYFEERSNVLQGHSVAALERAAAGWRHSNAPIVVEGHSRGSRFPVRGLAGRRAETVRNEMIALGIAPERIQVREREQSDGAFASVYPARLPEEYLPGNRR